MHYPGGKAKTFHQIVNLIPPHSVYIEPFLGQGSVLRAKRRSPIEIGIDMDPHCVQRSQYGARMVRLVHGDGINFLRSYPFEGHEVVYCDPPYLPTVRKRARVYRWDLSYEDHLRLLRVLTSIRASVIVSGYESALYERVLRSWSKRTYTAKAHDGQRREMLWFNYKAPAELHDYRYLGANFRERQTINRRIARLKNRIGKLSMQEQSLLREWLSTKSEENAA